MQRAEELDVLLEQALLGVGVGVLDLGLAVDPVVDRGAELGVDAVHARDVEPLLAEQLGEARFADDDVDAVRDVVVAIRRARTVGATRRRRHAPSRGRPLDARRHARGR